MGPNRGSTCCKLAPWQRLNAHFVLLKDTRAPTSPSGNDLALPTVGTGLDKA